MQRHRNRQVTPLQVTEITRTRGISPSYFVCLLLFIYYYHCLSNNNINNNKNNNNIIEELHHRRNFSTPSRLRLAFQEFPFPGQQQLQFTPLRKFVFSLTMTAPTTESQRSPESSPMTSKGQQKALPVQSLTLHLTCTASQNPFFSLDC